MNLLKAVCLLALLSFLILAAGKIIGGGRGMAYAFVLACAFSVAIYGLSDAVILKRHRARILDEKDAPEVYDILRELAAGAKIPMPKVYLVPSATPNAFAVARTPRHAGIVITQGIFKILNGEEMKGVLAHEIGHVVKRDTLISALAASLAGFIMMIVSALRRILLMGEGGRTEERDHHPLVFLAMSVLIPLAAAVIQLLISKNREYDADETGARLCENPLYLASALAKIEAGIRRLPMREAPFSTAHLFILNPLSGGAFTKLFNTHPPIERRIARLEQLSRKGF